MTSVTVAIKIGDCYFAGFGSLNQVMTASSIAGATLFVVGKVTSAQFDQACDKLRLKGKDFRPVVIGEVQP